MINAKQKVLVTGAGGQLAHELKRSVPGHIEAVFLSHADLDIADESAVQKSVAQNEPSWIINAAAYTAVDKAEDEPELAARVNTRGAANLAIAARQNSARLVQVSTDYVFDGQSGEPYLPDAAVNPLSVYGKTKHDGDQQCLEVLGDQAAVIRTSWVYSSHGHNFVKTILRLCAEKPQLTIVADQVGTPTWAGSLAGMCWKTIDQQASGIWHFTDAGVASWYDFAVAIQEIGMNLGLLEKVIPILPINSQDYPQKATRPKYSVLDKSRTWKELSVASLHWREALRRMMQELM